MAARQRRVRRLRGGETAQDGKTAGDARLKDQNGDRGGVARNHSLIWRTTMAGQRGEGGESGKIFRLCMI